MSVTPCSMTTVFIRLSPLNAEYGISPVPEIVSVPAESSVHVKLSPQLPLSTTSSAARAGTAASSSITCSTASSIARLRSILLIFCFIVLPPVIFPIFPLSIRLQYSTMETALSHYLVVLVDFSAVSARSQQERIFILKTRPPLKNFFVHIAPRQKRAIE